MRRPNRQRFHRLGRGKFIGTRAVEASKSAFQTANSVRSFSSPTKCAANFAQLAIGRIRLFSPACASRRTARDCARKSLSFGLAADKSDFLRLTDGR